MTCELRKRRERKRKVGIANSYALSCLLLTLAMPGQLNLNLAAVAFISSQNHPILVRALSGSPEDLLKYHYIAHTSLDVIDERS